MPEREEDQRQHRSNRRRLPDILCKCREDCPNREASEQCEHERPSDLRDRYLVDIVRVESDQREQYEEDGMYGNAAPRRTAANRSRSDGGCHTAPREPVL